MAKSLKILFTTGLFIYLLTTLTLSFSLAAGFKPEHPAPIPKAPPAPLPGLSGIKADGYRGIWFTLGQMSKYGDKYSGGLATYTADHIPIAIYAPKADKTFFVYGGTIPGQRHLLIMCSYYDHKTGMVPKPTIVYDKIKVDDPHDNASLAIDKKGYLWVFISGRAQTRPGFKFRSAEPYSIDKFEQITQEEMTYPQPWYVKGKGFFNLFTKYTKGRELYWETSKDGVSWSEDQKLAGFGGHYLVSNQQDGRFILAFNWHPGGSVNKRTNLYYLETRDWGKTWQNAAGKKVSVPLKDPLNDALVRNYQKDNKLVYIHDIQFTQDKKPVILFTTSTTFEPGLVYGPRIWNTARWTGKEWDFRRVTDSDHNYDCGSLYIEKDGSWRIFGPTEQGPQPGGTGGEVVIWTSHNQGMTWIREKQVTKHSKFNQSYVRRPLNAHPDFYAFWADGNPNEFSESHLYFCNQAGDKVWRLPDKMKGEFAIPELIKP